MIIYKNSHKEQILIRVLYGCFFVTVNSNVSLRLIQVKQIVYGEFYEIRQSLSLGNQLNDNVQNLQKYKK